jgi:hypothetical protein
MKVEVFSDLSPLHIRFKKISAFWMRVEGWDFYFYDWNRFFNTKKALAGLSAMRRVK